MKDLIAFLLGIIALTLIINLIKHYQKAPQAPPVVPPVDDGEVKSRQDIRDAQTANANISCISLLVSGISPHNSKTYEVGSPCDLNWLVDNRSWKKTE